MQHVTQLSIITAHQDALLHNILQSNSHLIDVLIEHVKHFRSTSTTRPEACATTSAQTRHLAAPRYPAVTRRAARLPPFCVSRHSPSLTAGSQKDNPTDFILDRLEVIGLEDAVASRHDIFVAAAHDVEEF